MSDFDRIKATTITFDSTRGSRKLTDEEKETLRNLKDWPQGYCSCKDSILRAPLDSLCSKSYARKRDGANGSVWYWPGKYGDTDIPAEHFQLLEFHWRREY